MRRLFRSLALGASLGAFLFGFLPSARAQSPGFISGSIEDVETGETLPGVNVHLEGVPRGAISAGDGSFRIAGLEPGTYVLVASLIGYASARDTIAVRAAAGAKVELKLRSTPLRLGEMLVQADRVFSTASSRAVRQFDLQVRPRRSTQQMLQMVPGLFIAQHAGGGKAEQIFLRGFDNDHGTDVAISVDGMPVNMVSQAHGQGYADLHFVIPELVERMEVFKGPYFAEYGNLANAGQVVFNTRDRIERNTLHLEGGQFNTARYVVLYQIPGADPRQSAYFAGEFYRTDGPFDRPQDLHRLNLFAKLRRKLSPGDALTLELGGYDAAWNASGQIPQRAVDSGRITRWGSIDDAEGGSTGRQYLNLLYRNRGGGGDLELRAYLGTYNFKLFSDFTFFLQDPIYGDLIEQTEKRFTAGMKSKYSSTRRAGALLLSSTLGGGFRSDNSEPELWQSIKRRRYWPLVQADIRERNFFLWGQEEVEFTPRLRLMLGLRGDFFTFQVDDRTEIQPTGLVQPIDEIVKQVRARSKPLHVSPIQPHASGLAQEFILSPKASLGLRLRRDLDLFINFGTGFHSNDARSAVVGQMAREQARYLENLNLSEEEVDTVLEKLNFDPGQRHSRSLPRTMGGEVGVRARALQCLNLGAALWWIDVDGEFLYSGDVGVTEKRGRTRRRGLDLETRLQLSSWLWADADLNLAGGRLRDQPTGADYIPLAPSFTSSGGLTLRHPRGWEGRLGCRHMGGRPASEDGRIHAQGYTVFDLSTSYRTPHFKIDLAVENLFDTEWNEAQFATRSLLPWEKELTLRGPGPDSEIHFTPGNPLNLRAGINYFY